MKWELSEDKDQDLEVKGSWIYIENAAKDLKMMVLREENEGQRDGKREVGESMRNYGELWWGLRVRHS